MAHTLKWLTHFDPIGSNWIQLDQLTKANAGTSTTRTRNFSLYFIIFILSLHQVHKLFVALLRGWYSQWQSPKVLNSSFLRRRECIMIERQWDQITAIMRNISTTSSNKTATGQVHKEWWEISDSRNIDNEADYYSGNYTPQVDVGWNNHWTNVKYDCRHTFQEFDIYSGMATQKKKNLSSTFFSKWNISHIRKKLFSF